MEEFSLLRLEKWLENRPEEHIYLHPGDFQKLWSRWGAKKVNDSDPRRGTVYYCGHQFHGLLYPKLPAIEFGKAFDASNEQIWS